MKKVWEEDFKIKFNEIDLNNRIKTSSIFDLMQETGANHADDLKLSIQDLNSKELLWVLVRVKIKMHGVASWKDEVKVKTWPKCLDGLFATRDYSITKGNNELICSATTSWLIIDKDTMRPRKMMDVIPKDMPFNEDIHGINESLDKIKIEGDLVEQCSFKAVYSDLDVNKHVNNAKYVDWIMNSVSEDLINMKQLDSLRLDLLSETRLGDEIRISKGIHPEDNKVCYIQGMNETTQKKAFNAKIEWSLK